MTEIPFEDPQVSQNFNKWVQKSPKILQKIFDIITKQ